MDSLPKSKKSKLELPVIELLDECFTENERPCTPVEIPDYSKLEEDEWFPGVPRFEDVTPLKVVSPPYKEKAVLEEKLSTGDADLSVPVLIRKYGYTCEIHTIITEDGYILEMHRIPNRKGASKVNQVPILVVHGLLGSSADWIISGPKAGLGYILADRGYDVWLANCRGNTYSHKHRNLNPNKSMFWNYSFQDIANDDIPDMIDEILRETKKSQLYYIGHSQGTTVCYSLCNRRPEYNYKIAAMVSLAPVAYMDHMVSPMLRLASEVGGTFEVAAALFGDGEFMPHEKLLREVSKYFACDGSSFQILYTNSMFMTCGFSPEEMDASLIPVIMGHTPAGMSTKQLLHYGQEIRSKRFCEWDYGFVDNRLLYRHLRPPKYNPRQIKCPMYLFYSRNDWISSDLDVGKFFLELEESTCKEAILVGDGKYNNLDYLYGIHAPTKVYALVLEKLKTHSGL